MIEIVAPGRLEPLAAERDGRGLFRVASPVTVRLGDHDITVPEGFITDGASIPWWWRWRFDPWGRCGVAAVVHDWFVTRAELPKWQIDWVFYGLLKASGVSDLQAGMMFLAVRTRR